MRASTRLLLAFCDTCPWPTMAFQGNEEEPGWYAGTGDKLRGEGKWAGPVGSLAQQGASPDQGYLQQAASVMGRLRGAGLSLELWTPRGLATRPWSSQNGKSAVGPRGEGCGEARNGQPSHQTGSLCLLCFENRD